MVLILQKTSCGIDNEDNYGPPFIVEYRKRNGALSRKIIKNENFNFDCIIDENKKVIRKKIMMVMLFWRMMRDHYLTSIKMG